MLSYLVMSPENISSNTNTQPYYLEPEKESQAKVVAKKTGRAVYLIAQIIIGISVVGIVLYLFVLPINIVDGQSMQPNFCNRDIYLTYKLESYFSRNPYKRGDVIALRKDSNTNLIKRIVGMPGDRVRIERGKVYINDNLFNEPYLQPSVITSTGEFFPLGEGVDYTVPRGQYMAFGDNRPFSLDSRDIGPVDPIDNAINGKVVMIIWPPQRIRVFDPNSQFAANACSS